MDGLRLCSLLCCCKVIQVGHILNPTRAPYGMQEEQHGRLTRNNTKNTNLAHARLQRFGEQKIGGPQTG